MRRAACTLALALVVCAAGSARADQVGMLPFEGKNTKTLRAKTIAALEGRGLDVIDVDRIGDAPESKAYLRGSVDKRKKKWRLRVEVIDARTGRTLTTVQMLARSKRQLPRQIKRLLWKRARKALSRARPARAKKPEKPVAASAPEREALEPKRDAPAREPDQTAAREPDRDGDDADDANDAAESTITARAAAGDGPARVDLAVASRLYSRRLRYNDDLFESLYGHTADGTVELGAEAAYHVTPWLSARGRFALTRPFDSTLDDTPYRTHGSSFAAGVHGHLPSRVLGLGVDLGARSLLFDPAGDPMAPPPLPNVRYQFVRAGIDAQRGLGGSLTAGAGAGYRYVYGAGQIAGDAYFPRLSVAAVDAAVWVDYRLARAWRVGVGAELERYFFAMNPEPGDANVAGGAIDQYLGATLRLTVEPGRLF